MTWAYRRLSGPCVAAHHIVRWHARKLHESLLPKRGIESAGLFRPPGGQALHKKRTTDVGGGVGNRDLGLVNTPPPPPPRRLPTLRIRFFVGDGFRVTFLRMRLRPRPPATIVVSPKSKGVPITQSLPNLTPQTRQTREHLVEGQASSTCLLCTDTNITIYNTHLSDTPCRSWIKYCAATTAIEISRTMAASNHVWFLIPSLHCGQWSMISWTKTPSPLP